MKISPGRPLAMLIVLALAGCTASGAVGRHHADSRHRGRSAVALAARQPLPAATVRRLPPGVFYLMAGASEAVVRGLAGQRRRRAAPHPAPGRAAITASGSQRGVKIVPDGRTSTDPSDPWSLAILGPYLASAVGWLPSLRSGVNGQAGWWQVLLRRKIHRYMH